MLDKIKKNKSLIIVLAIITIAMVLVFIMMNRCSRKMIGALEENGENIYQTKKTENKISLNMSKDLKRIIHELANKENDWSEFPLSNNFLKKYNNKDGIFFEYKGYNKVSHDTQLDLNAKEVKIKDNKFDVEYSLKWYLNPEVDIRTENYYRLYDITVTFLINDKGEIDDIIKGEPEIIFEDGAPNIEYDKEVTKDNFISLLKEVLFLDIYNKFAPHYINPKYIKKEPCSKKLCDKVLNADKNVFRVYKDFFELPDAGGGGLCILKETTIEEAFNSREVYAVCNVYPEEIDPYYDDVEPTRYLYKVNFILDEDKKLDDFTVEYINEIFNEELENYNFNIK